MSMRAPFWVAGRARWFATISVATNSHLLWASPRPGAWRIQGVSSIDLHVSNKSQIAGQALSYISALYDVEREVKDLTSDERLKIRQARSRPLADALYQWMELQRSQITDGSATAKAIDYSLQRWGALTRFLDDGQLPIDSNWAENQIRPIAVGRKNWLFAGSLRAGQRAAAVMSLIQNARLNGLDAYAYLKDGLQCLPTHKNHLIADLLPHRWHALHI